uniref:Uncharacterized protein n=1 Tax=Sphaerodactylus townsendi TaxID=933632 RepID=A0ACB8GA35_9SAUR
MEGPFDSKQALFRWTYSSPPTSDLWPDDLGWVSRSRHGQRVVTPALSTFALEHTQSEPCCLPCFRSVLDCPRRRPHKTGDIKYKWFREMTT